MVEWMSRVEMTGVQTTKRDGPGQRTESNLVLGPEEVRLGGSPVRRENGSTRAQRAGAQTTKGKRAEVATGSGRGGVPQPGGWWPGRGIRVRARAAVTQASREPGFETWPASPS